MSDDRVRLEIDGAVAVITNDNPDKKNAFDDEMDARLFEILRGLRERDDVRVVIWRGEGSAWSSGRDVSAIGGGQVELSHHQLMTRGIRGIQQLWDLEVPVIVPIQGWAIGGSFQRALLCDIRIAAEGARFMLPETKYGVIPDTGGVSVLYQIDGEDGPSGDPPSGPARAAGRHGGRADLPDLHQQVRRLRGDAGGPRRGPAPRVPGELMTEPIGLPDAPGPGAHALPAGTYDGDAVVITGGGTGLGKAIALEFGRLGASVGVLSRSDEHLEAATEALGGIGADVATAPCDIRDPDAIATAMDAIEAALGRPRVLVNNAAANFPVPAEDMSPNAWRTVVDITLNGTFFCAREFARRHLEAGTPASIVNVGASYAWTGGPGFAHSAAAKAGVKNMVETLAVEWGPYGIQVNGLVPGLMPHDDMTADIRANLDRPAGSPPTAGSRDGTHDRFEDGAGAGAPHDKDPCQPALRVGRPRELGWAATFLASPFARFISGHTLVVDGANWQRRTLTNPEVVTVRDQMGKGPFDPAPPSR
jgi:NAD(P)-dependent dehydrogenase (short-subunit alcohol dehydrogenase family)